MHIRHRFPFKLRLSHTFTRSFRSFAHHFFLSIPNSHFSVIMTSQDPTPRLFMDMMSYRPRHANIGVDHDYQLSIPSALPQRPKNFNTFGRECGITLNTFNIATDSSKVVHQYDVHFTGDSKDYTKRVLLKKIWNSQKVKADLGGPNNLWVWDGNKLAW
jgi:eukaryotic translation initiation factor 2C